jgi:hypothetical protein
MWTSKNRVRYKRDHLRYPSDVTDEEWAHIGPLIPPAKRGGRKREVDPRDVVDHSPGRARCCCALCGFHSTPTCEAG